MTRTDGIYGGRFSGAGFKGCCMALIDPSFKEEIFKKSRLSILPSSRICGGIIRPASATARTA